MKQRTALVRLDGKPAGRLQEKGDEIAFQYDAAWLAQSDSVPISLTLPLRPEPYVQRGLHPFFENLLPEGWLLELATKKLKVAKDDPFGLLIATCADCIGAVEIVREEEGSK